MHARVHVCACPMLSWTVKSDSLQPMDCSLLGSSVYGIFQARILEQVSTPFSRGSSWPKDQTHVSQVSCHGRKILLPLSHLGSPNVSLAPHKWPSELYFLLVCGCSSPVTDLILPVLLHLGCHLFRTAESIFLPTPNPVLSSPLFLLIHFPSMKPPKCPLRAFQALASG